jgi:hypothetical protein
VNIAFVTTLDAQSAGSRTARVLQALVSKHSVTIFADGGADAVPGAAWVAAADLTLAMLAAFDAVVYDHSDSAAADSRTLDFMQRCPGIVVTDSSKESLVRSAYGIVVRSPDTAAALDAISTAPVCTISHDASPEDEAAQLVAFAEAVKANRPVMRVLDAMTAEMRAMAGERLPYFVETVTATLDSLFVLREQERP